MNKELFKEFVKFCDSQPKDKAIDHYSWSSCAVGEFFGSKGVRGAYRGSTEIADLLGPHCFEDDRDSNPLAYAISTASHYGKYKTYGNFTKLLKSYL